MFDKLLKSIGIGSASVDTRLPKRNYMVGETIEGTTFIKGGTGSQTIDSVYLSLMTDYEVEVDDHKVRRSVELDRIQLFEPFVLNAGEERVIPFRLRIPMNTPATMGKSAVWLQTGLDIKMAIDPQDRDVIDVAPHPLVNAFIEAASQLGFRLYKVDCEKAPFSMGGAQFVQEFEFKALGGEFRGRLDELEAVFQLTETQVNVTLQIDRRVRDLGSFLAESMGMDESYVRFTFTQADLPNLPQIIANTIRPYC